MVFMVEKLKTSCRRDRLRSFCGYVSVVVCDRCVFDAVVPSWQQLAFYDDSGEDQMIVLGQQQPHLAQHVRGPSVPAKKALADIYSHRRLNASTKVHGI